MNFPSLVFGTWRLGDKSNPTPHDILNRIESLLSYGINTFDLADIYGGYTYEKLFGSALALQPSLRDKLVLVTKCNIQYPVGANRPGVDVHYYDTSKDYIIKAVERSCEMIGTSYVDCLLLHRPDPLMDADQVSEAFVNLKSRGLVRHFGVSNFTPSQFDLLQSRLDFKLVTNQVEFSVLHTTPMFDGTFDHAQMHRYQPMIWSPLAGGKLFSTPDTTTEEGKKIERVLKVIKEIGAEIGNAGIDQIAYAFIHQLPCKPSVVVGTNDMKRVKSLTDGLQIKLSKPQWFRILEASQGCEVP